MPLTLMFQMMIWPLMDPEASREPSWEKLTNHTSSEWSERTWTVSEGNWFLQERKEKRRLAGGRVRQEGCLPGAYVIC